MYELAKTRYNESEKLAIIQPAAENFQPHAYAATGRATLISPSNAGLVIELVHAELGFQLYESTSLAEFFPTYLVESAERRNFHLRLLNRLRRISVDSLGTSHRLL